LCRAQSRTAFCKEPSERKGWAFTDPSTRKSESRPAPDLVADIRAWALARRALPESGLGRAITYMLVM